MLLTGKRVVVTGSAQGLGAATVRAYVAEGAIVAALDVNVELGETEAAAAQGPGRANFYACNVADRASVQNAFGAIEQAHGGGIDVLAHVAGVERGAPAEAISDEQYDLIFDVNVRGTMLTNQAAFALMKKDGGSIINFGSGAALKPYPGGAHYSASKGAVMAWTRTVSREWGPYGIRVNSVAPAIRTKMADEAYRRLSVEDRAAMDERHRQQIAIGGKLGDPDRDLAPVMVFLAGDGSRFITGQIIAVNGGSESVR